MIDDEMRFGCFYSIECDVVKLGSSETVLHPSEELRHEIETAIVFLATNIKVESISLTLDENEYLNSDGLTNAVLVLSKDPAGTIRAHIEFHGDQNRWDRYTHTELLAVVKPA